MKKIRCTFCREEFTEEEIKGHYCCPKCKDPGVPCSIENDVNITINTHELRILFIWAENFAGTLNKQDRQVHKATELVDKLAQYVESQLPAEKWVPLTLSRELRDLQERFPKKKIKFINKDGEEKDISEL